MKINLNNLDLEPPTFWMQCQNSDSVVLMHARARGTQQKDGGSKSDVFQNVLFIHIKMFYYYYYYYYYHYYYYYYYYYYYL